MANERRTAAIDVTKFRKILKDHGTNATKLEKDIGKPIRKYVRDKEMPWSVIATIVLRDEFDDCTIDSFVDHREELYRDTAARVADLNRMVYLLRNEVKLLTRDNELLIRDNEHLSAIIHSYEMLPEKEDDNEQLD